MAMLSRKKALSIWNESIERVSQRQVWSAALLVVSSAALGGIAVALWNRQALGKMRDPIADKDVDQLDKDQLQFFDVD